MNAFDRGLLASSAPIYLYTSQIPIVRLPRSLLSNKLLVLGAGREEKRRGKRGLFRVSTVSNRHFVGQKAKSICFLLSTPLLACFYCCCCCVAARCHKGGEINRDERRELVTPNFWRNHITGGAVVYVGPGLGLELNLNLNKMTELGYVCLVKNIETRYK